MRLVGIPPAAGITSLDAQPKSAIERLSRVLYLVVGVAGIVFGALSHVRFSAQVYAPIPVISYVTWALVIGLPAALFLLSHSAHLRMLRTIATVYAAVFLITLSLWLAARAEPLPPGADIPWMIPLTGVAAVGIAVAARRRTVVAYSLTVAVLGGLLRAATTRYAHPTLLGVEDLLYSLLMQSVFVGLTLATRRAAAELDRADLIARENAAKEAARIGGRQARLAMDALVHDSVMSTLLFAGRQQTDAHDVSRHAARTLAQLDEAREFSDVALKPPSCALEEQVKALVAELAPGTVVRNEVARVCVLPMDVREALLGAVGEALRNSFAYAAGSAGRPVSRSIVLRERPGRLELVLRDDGVGFDPAEVPGDRLGISRSIEGRMRSVAGGDAAVSSSPGAGCEVVLSWALPL